LPNGEANQNRYITKIKDSANRNRTQQYASPLGQGKLLKDHSLCVVNKKESKSTPKAYGGQFGVMKRYSKVSKKIYTGIHSPRIAVPYSYMCLLPC